jgi:MFS family permease
MGHAAIEALPAAVEVRSRSSIAALFAPSLARTTVLLTVAYFAHIMTFYFTLKWIPEIVVDMGFAPALAGSVLVWANVGGVTGSVLLGLLTHRYPVRRLVLATLILGAGMVALFGRGQADLAGLSLIAACVGFFTNAAVVGLYAMFAQSFPTELRASGTGFVIGFGRGGSALAPIVAGLLFAAGGGLQGVALLMAMGSLLAAVMVAMLRSEQPTAPSAG